MTVVMMGDIADAIERAVARAVPYVERAILGAAIRDAMPERGIVIEATREELQSLPSNILYREVEVNPKESEVKK